VTRRNMRCPDLSIAPRSWETGCHCVRLGDNAKQQTLERRVCHDTGQGDPKLEPNPFRSEKAYGGEIQLGIENDRPHIFGKLHIISGPKYHWQRSRIDPRRHLALVAICISNQVGRSPEARLISDLIAMKPRGIGLGTSTSQLSSPFER